VAALGQAVYPGTRRQKPENVRLLGATSRKLSALMGKGRFT
jgi:hypothetical protein